MSRRERDLEPHRRARGIVAPFLGAAHILAGIAGFGFGLLMVGAVAGWWPVGAWWPGLAVAHGAVQLFGWGALWVLGVGTLLLPKLAGVPLAGKRVLPCAAWILAAGLLAFVVAAVASALEGRVAGGASRVTLGLSALLVPAGIGMAVARLAATLRAALPLSARPRLRRIAPLLVPALAGLVVAGVAHGGLALHAAWIDTPMASSPGHRAVAHLLLSGFLVPMALGVGALVAPPFFRFGLVSRTGLAVVACILFGAVWAGALGHGRADADVVRVAGAFEGAAYLAYLLLLGHAALRPPPALWPPGRRPATRRLAFDRGEHGPFEWLVFGAWFWLALGGAIRLAGGPDDAARHALGLGFVTLLITGMALRLLPGLVGRRPRWPAIAWPLLAAGTLAAAGRVLPLLVHGVPGGALLFGLSGVAGLVGVALLAVHVAQVLAPERERTQEMHRNVA